MRKWNGVGLAMVVSLLAVVPASAQTSSVERSGALLGFGGLTIDSGSTSSPNLGGNLTFALTPSVHVIGEVGRLGNVLPPLSDSLFSFAGVKASAFYGEGGVRFVAAPRSAVSPYGEATAGVARIGLSSSRLGTIGDLILPSAFSFVSRTGPVAGVGGGLLVRTGPVVFDVGYRYKQLYPPAALEVALGLGEELRSHQVRAGIGVAF